MRIQFLNHQVHVSIYLYHETFEVDERLLHADVVPVHKLRELRNKVTCIHGNFEMNAPQQIHKQTNLVKYMDYQMLLTSIALSDNVEIAVLVLQESLEPFHQERVRVMGCETKN